MLLIPAPASRRYHPDVLEVEAIAHVLGSGPVRARFSDPSGRERGATSWRELRAAPLSGVLIVETSFGRIVSSEALLAVSDAACPCGADARLDLHELYKRTHGGAAPARLLRACALGHGLRGRCPSCRRSLSPDSVRSSIEAPFAHLVLRVPAAEPSLLAALQRATGPVYRAVSESGSGAPERRSTASLPSRPST